MALRSSSIIIWLLGKANGLFKMESSSTCPMAWMDKDLNIVQAECNDICNWSTIVG
jgi:hypothetical protein